MIALIFGMAISGLFIGGLGRLVVPGPNPIGFLRTIAVGIVGSFLGGLVGRLAFGFRYRDAFGLALILSVAFTALIVYAIERPRVTR